MCVYNCIPLPAQMPLLVPSTLRLVLLAKVVNFCILMAWVGVFFDGNFTFYTGYQIPTKIILDQCSAVGPERVLHSTIERIVLKTFYHLTY